MNLKRLAVATLSTAILLDARAQVPEPVATALREMGAVIEVPKTVTLYEPRVRRVEPDGSIKVERDISYGGSPRHLLDIFRSRDTGDGLRPILLFVHGGAFVRGNRRLGPASPFYDNVMLWAVEQGMTGISMTYRLAPDAPWPGGAADIGHAIAWIKANGARHGGDSSRIFLMGHSAGATHVGTYLSRPELQPGGTPGVAGALLLSGVFDITTELVAGSPTYPQYFGTDPAQYAGRSSLPGLLRSPVRLWVARAELDPPSFVQQAQLLRKSLCEAGRCPASADFPGHTHMSEIFSFGSDDRSVSDAALRFIRESP